uniref:Ornithine decarboxylase antizyme n=1 Tax=Macrostomum lignano TaxID=282301 RepID=A0A1I8FNA7_9PLAT
RPFSQYHRPGVSSARKKPIVSCVVPSSGQFVCQAGGAAGELIDSILCQQAKPDRFKSRFRSLTAHRSRSHDEAAEAVQHQSSSRGAPLASLRTDLQFSRTSALLKLMLKAPSGSGCVGATEILADYRRRHFVDLPAESQQPESAGKGEDAKDVDPALETETAAGTPPISPCESTPVLELPVHYWFHIYLHSYDCDRLLTPFVKSMMEDFPTDRRLLSIMNSVRVSLGQLEMYKSLPRYVFILNGANWDSIIRALVENGGGLPRTVAGSPVTRCWWTLRRSAVLNVILAPDGLADSHDGDE